VGVDESEYRDLKADFLKEVFGFVYTEKESVQFSNNML
jgi:hypothetical protein